MKKFFKKHYPKVICALTIISLLCMFTVTSFAFIPLGGVNYNVDDLVYKYFNNLTATSLKYYRYIISEYNWNYSENFTDVAYCPVLPSMSKEAGNEKLYTCVRQLANNMNITELTDYMYNEYILSYETLLFFDVSTSKTTLMFIPTEINKPALYYYKLNSFGMYQSSGTGMDGNVYRQSFTLTASGTGIAGASATSYAYMFTFDDGSLMTNGTNTVTYQKVNISTANKYLAVENIVFASSGIYNFLNTYYSTSKFINFYTTNFFNSIAYVNFNNRIVYDSDLSGIADLNQPYLQASLGNVDPDLSHVYLFVDVVVPGITNFDIGNYLRQYTFIPSFSTLASVNGTVAGTTSVRFYVNDYQLDSIYLDENSSGNIDLYVHRYIIHFEASTSDTLVLENVRADFSVNNEIISSDMVFSNLDNNSLRFMINIEGNNINQDIFDLWNDLSDGFKFVEYLIPRIFNIMPAPVYSFLSISLTLVILLATVRLIIS